MDLSTVTRFRPARERADLALGPGEALLAGGSWLFSEPQPHLTGLVDLTAMGWPDWEPGDGGLRVAATCTIERLQRAPVPPGIARLLREAADALAMSFKIQAMATVGGNLALALPAGAVISVAAALDAEAVVWTPGGGERREAVAGLVRGPGRTSLAPGEVLRAVDLPAASLAARTAFRRTSLNTLGRSASVVIGRLDEDSHVSLTVTAATPRPVVLRFAGVPGTQELDGALDGVDGWYDDPHGAPDWREAVTRTLAREVCDELAGVTA
ncbi:xanthine dehydrogenase family protein subunit M [Nocardioides sp. cx-173]|uniref:FAD binding domain-containing protein n=1 Tax=Nocardioides sp. cx-173 TaxID=2898796 RepID=UPI001E45F4F1|nr:FAD binding domain-containing protein [Nocardioides sp. cx-173]MCD4525592.1 FAD binding domain-containing protein [Nocardioides sp. cx-173]UGB42736.1 FAD binding domain-containing protein [Nocardioides sp. cx-173]